jgi:hypothetical protein
VYIVFITLVVTIGFAIIYPQPTDKHFRIVFGITIAKFSLDLVNNFVGYSSMYALRMLFVCCVFDLCVLITVLYLIAINLKRVSTTITYLSRNAD